MTHRLPSISSSPLAPKHSAPTAVGYCCSYCYNTRGWYRLAQIIVNQGETRKRGGIHTRVLAGGAKLSRWAVAKPDLPATSSSVTSSLASSSALSLRHACWTVAVPGRRGSVESPNLAQKVPPVAHRDPPGPHSRGVNSCPRERQGGYEQIPPYLPVATGHPGGYYCNYSGCPLLREVCVCVFSSHSFWTSSSLDVPAGVTQEEGHTGFPIPLLSAVRALIFLARRIQPFLSLVDREVEFCVLTI